MLVGPYFLVIFKFLSQAFHMFLVVIKYVFPSITSIKSFYIELMPIHFLCLFIFQKSFHVIILVRVIKARAGQHVIKKLFIYLLLHLFYSLSINLLLFLLLFSLQFYLKYLFDLPAEKITSFTY